MSDLANKLRNLTFPTQSKATDKLNALIVGVDALAQKNPALLNRVTSLSIEWQQLGSEIVPNINIELRDEPERLSGGSLN